MILQHLTRNTPANTEPLQPRVHTFDGDRHILVEHEGADYFAPMLVCQALALNWSPQASRIHADPVFSPLAKLLTVQTSVGPQDFLCLPLDFMNAWVYTLNAASVPKDKKSKVSLYKQYFYTRIIQEKTHTTVAQAPSPMETVVAQLGQFLLNLGAQLTQAQPQAPALAAPPVPAPAAEPAAPATPAAAPVPAVAPCTLASTGLWVPQVAEQLGYGRVQFYQLLRDNNILMDAHRHGDINHNLPFQQHINRGYFTVERYRGLVRAKVTPAGQKWLAEKFSRKPLHTVKESA